MISVDGKSFDYERYGPLGYIVHGKIGDDSVSLNYIEDLTGIIVKEGTTVGKYDFLKNIFVDFLEKYNGLPNPAQTHFMQMVDYQKTMENKVNINKIEKHYIDALIKLVNNDNNLIKACRE
jgi:hypothetical protein